MSETVRRPWWPEVLLLLIISIMAAWLVNAVRPDPVPWWADFKERKVEETRVKGFAVLGPAEARAVHASGGRLFVDARDRSEYAAGRIPGAVNVPAEALITGLDEALAGIPKDKPVLVYCSDVTCSKARDLAEGMRQAGFTAVAVMPEGMDGWRAVGGMVEVR
jgi:rhodanese-related sulfurtransferase